MPRRTLRAALPSGAAALLFLLLAPHAHAVAPTAEVQMTDFEFEPPTAYVMPGGNLTFRNTGQELHTATAQDGADKGTPRFDSGNVGPGGTWTFNATLPPGRYPIWCVHHAGRTADPSAPITGMVGEIVILNPDGSEPATAAPPAPAPETPAPGVLAALGALALAGLVGRRR